MNVRLGLNDSLEWEYHASATGNAKILYDKRTSCWNEYNGYS